MAKCAYCGNEGAVPTFVASDCQVGMNYICKDKACIKAHTSYLERTGFEHIGSSDEYGEWCGKPENGAGAALRETRSFIDLVTFGPLRRAIGRLL